MPVQAQGTEFFIGDGEDPEEFNKVAKLTDFTGPGGSGTVIDATTLDSTAREKMPGLMDEGQFSFNLVFDPEDAEGQMALMEARAAQEIRNFELILKNGRTGNFAGFVLEFPINGAVDEIVRGSCTIEITGPVTWTDGSS